MTIKMEEFKIEVPEGHEIRALIEQAKELL